MGHDDNTYGTIEVIAGPMFAGKSEELLRRIIRLWWSEPPLCSILQLTSPVYVHETLCFVYSVSLCLVSVSLWRRQGLAGCGARRHTGTALCRQPDFGGPRRLYRGHAARPLGHAAHAAHLRVGAP